MTAGRPLFEQSLDLGTAAELRHQVSAYFGARSWEAVAPAQGAIAHGHGVLSSDAMKVSPQPTATNSVRVAPGFAVVRASQNNSQGSYFCPLDGYENLTISAKHASSTRVDLIVAQVRDDDFAGVDNEWQPEVVTGTPGAGTPSVPEDCLVLAVVTVAPGSGATVITSAAIQDVRVQARATGGITPVTSTAAVWGSPQEYDTIFDQSDNQLKIRISGAWVTIGRDLSANWTSYTPTATMVTLGGGGEIYGRYQNFGGTIIGICGFFLGLGGSISTTPLALGLPFASANPGPSTLRYMGFGRAVLGAGPAFWSATGLIVPGSQEIGAFATAGTGSWVGPSTPATWGPGDKLRILYSYEV